MKQKLHLVWGSLITQSAASALKTVLRSLFLSYGHGSITAIPAPVKMTANRCTRTLLLFVALISGTSLMAQTITGSTSVCVGANTVLGADQAGGTWSSSNTAVANVDPGTGVVTGVAAGTATISYTLSGIPVTTTVTVNSLLDAGTISGGTGVCIGSSITLTNSVSGGVWSTDNAVISVSPTNGIVTGHALGSANVLYTVTNSCGSASSSVNVMVNGFINDIYTFAGTGTAGFSGDGGAAYLAKMGNPRDLFVEPTSGTLYFCDPSNNRVRKITRSGIITTVAGNGTSGSGGDGHQATAATLSSPNGVFVDPAGNIFISNTFASTIRKVDPSGIISTIAGTGTAGNSGDGGPAIAAKINFPLGIIEDAAGNVYIADQANNNIRKISTSGIITTVVGDATTNPGIAGYSGDGGPGAAALLRGVRGLTMDNSGNIYIADADNNVIRKYVPSTGFITTIAGTGFAGHTGDGDSAIKATLTTPARFAYDGANILYISDQLNNEVRQINLGNGIISQVAGVASLTGDFSGDGGSALSAHLNTPAGIAGDHFGNFYIADAVNNRIRVVPSTGSLAASIVGPGTVCSGTPVSFTAFLSSSGSPVYQWQKNGINIGTGGATLTDPSPSDGDKYRCIVTVTPVCSAPFNDTSNDIPVVVQHTANTITVPSTIYAGQSAQLGETVPGGTWSSSAAGIATVDASGILYGVSAGTTAVTYTLTNSCGSTSTNITVSVTAPDTIMAFAGPNGHISPDGPVSVTGGDEVFTIIPDAGFHINDVLVDGISVGTISTYVFPAVSGTHTISASFAPDCTIPTISATTSGSVCGSGTVSLSATANAGVINWYTASSGGTSLQSGSTYSAAISSTTTYYVDATDGTCVSARTAIIATANATPSASATVTNVSCFGMSTGTVTVTGFGGTPGYLISGDATSGLIAGTYNYTVTDANGCSATTTATVIQPASPVSATVTTGSISCHGTTTTASVTGLGGTGVLTGTGVYSVSAGTYSYAVVDANGCSATTSVTITEPSQVTASAAAGTIACNGQTTTATVSGSGGTGTLTGTGINTVHAGTYTYTVTDANGCSATTTITITEPAPVSVTATPGLIPCFGGTTTILVAGIGGTGLLSGTGTYTVDAGIHIYTITDANGCSATTTTNVTQPLSLTVSTAVTASSCGGEGDGGISTSVTGGTGAYSYSWNISATASILTGLLAGTYSVTVTDSHGCIAIAAATVTSLSAPSCSITITPAFSLLYTGGVPNNIYLGYGPQTATITAVPTGGTGFTYSWSPSAHLSCTTCRNPLFTPTAAGNYTYTVTVTNSNGCTSQCTVSFCVLDVRDPSHPGKILVVHYPPGNPGNPQTLSIALAAVPAHLALHDEDHIGAVGQECGSSGRYAAPASESPTVMEDNLSVAAYPNPFGDELHLKIESNSFDFVDLLVTDITGRIRDTKLNQQIGSDISLGQGLTPGIYFVNVRHGDVFKIVKIVKY